MNSIDQILKLWNESWEARCKLADENRKKGIPDPLNDLTDSFLDDTVKLKIKKQEQEE